MASLPRSALEFPSTTSNYGCSHTRAHDGVIDEVRQSAIVHRRLTTIKALRLMCGPSVAAYVKDPSP
jgi:hypothetical protein